MIDLESLMHSKVLTYDDPREWFMDLCRIEAFLSKYLKPGSHDFPPSYGGFQPFHLVSAASVNNTLVKSAPGVIYMISAFNQVAGDRFLKLYDKATTPVAGTDTPVWTKLIPGSPSGTPGAGFILSMNPYGLQFNNGIGFAITANMPDNDNTAIAANDVVVNLGFR